MPTALITGGNRGIGLELVKVLKQHSYEVIAVCRSVSDELQDLADKIIPNIDLNNEDSLKASLKEIPASIDLLIQNAGILSSDTIEDLQREPITSQFVVNALAPIQYTSWLIPKIREGGKVAFITSRMGSIQDNTSGGNYGYRMSKAALNAGAKSLAVDLAGKNIDVAILHPGFVKTRMTSYKGEISPQESAKGLFKQIQKLDASRSGCFYHSNGEELPF